MKGFVQSAVLGWAMLLASSVTTVDVAMAQSHPTAEELQFFEKHIRPVLVKECYACHAADAKEIQGGLTLDTRDGMLAGGDTGPSLVPGNTKQSLILQAIKQVDDDLQMPPKKKLPDEVIAQFEKWIAMGAPDPRDGASAAAKNEIDIEQGRQFWSFQPPQKAAPPTVKNSDWPQSDIDHFLLAALEAKGLQPVADADPPTLIRRLYFDLIGLPPTPRDVADFESEIARTNSNPNQSASRIPQSAIEPLVDKLLDSPRFGERWGRHWLDVARYAESSGRATNFAYPHAWRYRDWVISAFNQDKPYDQFIREQLAGDLLQAADNTERASMMVATGFLAIGPKTHSEQNREQFRLDLADEQIDATFQAFQALTVACARCHDHKFDPIPQTDYYALAGIFRNTETCYGTIRIVQSNHPSPLLELPRDANVAMPLEPLTSSRRDAIERQIQDQRDQMDGLTGQDGFLRRIFLQIRVAQLESQLDLYDADGTPRPLAMGVREARATQPSHVLIRGEIDQPGERVSRGFPQVLTKVQPGIRYGTSGRLELANFIASQDNPLTARVIVNRVWLHLIGQGLVPTPDNFGATGLRPSHPELLDYLAVSLVENGWSLKKLIRSIVLTRAYQLSSQFDAKSFESDPDNVLVWRMPKRRLEAEALRDTMLLLGGRLNLDAPIGGEVSRGGEGDIGFRFRGDPAASDAHRTVYLPIVRDQLPDVLSIFDFPDPSLIIGERATTTIPSQSLFLMNDAFVIRQADSLAARITSAGGSDEERIEQVYKLCYSRAPSDTETNNALQFLDNYGKRHSRRSSWAALCQAMLASAEFSQR